MNHDAERLLDRAGQAWRSRLLPALEAALGALPEREADVLHLTYVRQEPDEAIARVLGFSGGASEVDALRTQAHERLRASFGEHALTPEQVASLLATAGAAWRLESQRPLPEASLEAGRRVLTRLAPDDTAGTAPGNTLAPERRAIRLRPLRWAKVATRTAAVFFVLVAIYGILWSVGRAVRPPTYALASVEAYEQELRIGVREGGSTLPEGQAALTEGAGALLQAPTSTLGLFPRYDASEVARAIAALEVAFRLADDPFVRARAAFFLAKAYLMREDPAEARRWLERVLAQDVALYRQDAEALLRALSAS